MSAASSSAGRLARSAARRAQPAAKPDPILRHWREAVPNDRLAHLVRDTARALTRELQELLVAHGVPFGHWAFLRILWEQDGLSQKELSDQAGVMEPTTYAAMRAMEAQGYILRSQTPGNRKNVYVHLTRKGRALKPKLVPLAEQVNQMAGRGLARADLQVTRNTLLAMLENLAREAP